jgi:hypothetical protein
MFEILAVEIQILFCCIICSPPVSILVIWVFQAVVSYYWPLFIIPPPPPFVVMTVLITVVLLSRRGIINK